MEDIVAKNPGAQASAGPSLGGLCQGAVFTTLARAGANVQVLVTGSLHLVGGVLKTLQSNESQ